MDSINGDFFPRLRNVSPLPDFSFKFRFVYEDRNIVEHECYFDIQLKYGEKSISVARISEDPETSSELVWVTSGHSRTPGDGEVVEFGYDSITKRFFINEQILDCN